MHPNDQLTTVFATESGRVSTCACCDLFQVSFGNAVFCLHPDRVKSMVAFIDGTAPPSDATVVDRTYMLRAGSRTCAFVFNYSELQALKQLLEGAQAMYSLKTMVASATGLANSIY